MMSQTTTEKLTLERQLQRIERANPDHFRFPRETPRKQRSIRFVADRRERVELRDAVIGFVAFVGLIAALATAPWWLS
ncbi:MAG: hypothetical protein QG619_1293 [Pseudomonadota bacterium]|nr:hypothetical protein [Pseudomonadota bacterium]